MTLDRIAQRYHALPSALVRLQGEEFGDYEAYCLDEAIYLAGISAELKAHDKAMEEREGGHAEIDPDRGLAGKVSGRVGVFSDEDRERYIKAGGKLPN